MNKAIIYTRKSKADEGNTIEMQKDRLNAYCQLNGLEVVEIVEEYGVSGTRKISTREGGAMMENLIKEGKIQHIVALKLDRLFRNTQDALEATTKWDKKGVSLHLVEMGGQSVNTGSAVGKLFITMMSAFATFERDLIAERTSASLRHKKANNKVFSNLPYGYDRVGNDLVKNAGEQQIIADVLEMRNCGQSLTQISNFLNEQGCKGKTGGKFYPKTVSNIITYQQSLTELGV